jgi:replicative DNA helicase
MNKIPFDEELEQSILFGAIYNPIIAEIVMDNLRKDWIYKPENIEIYQACVECHKLTGKIDPTTVVSVLERKQQAPAILNVLSGSKFASNESNIITHIEIVHEYYIRRKIIHETLKISDEAYDLNIDAYMCLDKLARSVTSIQDEDTKVHSMTPDEIIKIWDATPQVQPFLTGNKTLDTMIYAESGRHPGHLEVTNAHSGHGKTRYAIYKTALLANRGIKTHWFQLEDYGYKTAIMFKALLGDNADNIVISDSIFDVEQIKREARISVRESGTQNIVIDYVQNLSADRKSRVEDVEYISRQLTRMAIDLSCMVHLMSQITIADSQRKKWNLEPRASDVRWSKQLQQDAHSMTGIFRPFKIEGLGDEINAYDWNSDNIHKNSVFLRQLKTRYGEPFGGRYHLIDTNMGLVDYNDWVGENYVKNNAHRIIEPIIDEGTPF